jgi:hypothetical protein
MLRFMRGRVRDRKWRLFACLCCRRAWRLMNDGLSRKAVETAERFVRRRADAQELRRAAKGAILAQREAANREWSAEADAFFAETAEHCAVQAQNNAARAAVAVCCEKAREAARDASRAAVWAVSRAAHSAAAAALGFFNESRRGWPDGAPEKTAADQAPAWEARAAAERAEKAYQAALLRELLGNPFRPVRVESSWLRWLNGPLRKAFLSVYRQGRFEELPVLADALEDAGCVSAELLGHLRAPGEHVRGCWALDLLLRRE